MKLWIRVAVSLAIVWALAWGVMLCSHHARPTPTTVATYVYHTDLSTQSAPERAKEIARLEEMLNGLSFEERQQLRDEGIMQGFFWQLTPPEQVAFMDATLPAGFKQLMEAFNKMSPEKRREMIDRALAEIKKHEGERRSSDVDPKLVESVVQQGLRSFYNDANTAVKLDLAPLIEQIQQNIQAGR
ncbi:MAG: hypothetical protein ACFUZC_15395 [Chthoniobacteraceae bacterium]